MMLLELLLIAGWVLVHLFAGRIRLLEEVPRSRWLSFAGGISVTYVFLHLFPEMKEAQEKIGEDREWGLLAGQNIYLMALLGLVLFYGLERMVKVRRQPEAKGPGSKEGETRSGKGVFWLHIGSFSLYNALIGYLLVHREEQSQGSLLLFFLSMALHFLVNDYGLSRDHKNTYRRIGRWVLAGAIGAGWLTGHATEVGRIAVHLLFAFLAGGIILNVLKEELPEERQSRFLPFVAGVICYALLLLLLPT